MVILLSLVLLNALPLRNSWSKASVSGDIKLFLLDKSSFGVITTGLELLFDLPVGPVLPRVENIKSKKFSW